MTTGTSPGKKVFQIYVIKPAAILLNHINYINIISFTKMRFWSKQIQRVWNASSSAKIRLEYKIVVNNGVNVLLDVVRTSDIF